MKIELVSRYAVEISGIEGFDDKILRVEGEIELIEKSNRINFLFDNQRFEWVVWDESINMDRLIPVSEKEKEKLIKIIQQESKDQDCRLIEWGNSL